MSRLSDVRFDLADCRRDLREAQDQLKLTQAQAEQRAIDAAGGAKALGANADDRARALTIALGADSAYLAMLALVRENEYRLDRLEADLKECEDARKAAEWAIRAKLADGLFSRTDAPAYADGAVFDDAAAAMADGEISRLADDLPF